MSDAVLEQMTGKDVGRAMGRTAQCPTGGDTTPAVPHSVHKMKLDTSPELKECARRPLPDRYDHIYKLGNNAKQMQLTVGWVEVCPTLYT